jgi:glycosyltransferase involved in cell wall biosynthesis
MSKTGKFDVVMPTLNSASRIGNNMFREVLLKIYREIPVNKLIAVDDRSTDDTLYILRQFGALVIGGTGSLGAAREIGVRTVESEWFYFIDDDNLIPPHFHKTMSRYIDDKTAMICAVADNPSGNWYAKHEAIISRIYTVFRRPSAEVRRGYTGATLVRTEAIKNINIPPVPRMEDYYIKKYLEEKGWKTKIAADAHVIHHSRISDKAHYFDGYYMHKFGFVSLRRMILAWLLSYPKTLLTTIISEDVEIARNVPKVFYLRLKGYIDSCHSDALESNKGAGKKQSHHTWVIK